MDHWVTNLGHRLLSDKAGIGFLVCLGHISPSPTSARGIHPPHCPLPAVSMGPPARSSILFHFEDITGTSQPVMPLGRALQNSTEAPPQCQAPSRPCNKARGGWVTDRQPSGWDVFPGCGGLEGRGLCAAVTLCKPNQVRVPMVLPWGLIKRKRGS